MSASATPPPAVCYLVGCPTKGTRDEHVRHIGATTDFTAYARTAAAAATTDASDAVHRRAHRLSRQRNHEGYGPDDWRADGHTSGGACAACFAFADLAAQLSEALTPPTAASGDGASS